jgi:hypothetical protein
MLDRPPGKQEPASGRPPDRDIDKWGAALPEVPTTGTGESRRADSPADSVATKHHVISYAQASGRLAASRRNPARGVELLPSSCGLEPTPMQ